MTPTRSRGTLHHYTSSAEPLSAFSHDPDSESIVIIVTGLNGSLPAVGYCNELAQELATIGWQLVQVMLSSAGAGWGNGSVRQDAVELGQCIDYFKQELGAKRIVLMGHSTGTQDCITYHHLRLEQPQLLPITATILQAPVSDRECLQALQPDLDIESTLRPPPGCLMDSFIPPDRSQIWGAQAGITYRRWNSITARPESDEIKFDENEDFFSSDLSSRRWKNVFSPVEPPLLVLLGEKDEAYPASVTAQQMLELFRRGLGEDRWHPESRVIPGANHAIDAPTARVIMFEAVKAFLQSL